MAMPSGEKGKLVTHRPEQGHWRAKTKDGGPRGDRRSSQSLDDVKKLTRRGLAQPGQAPSVASGLRREPVP